MGKLTLYSRTAFLNHVYNATAYTPASTIYLALCTADPTESATGASCNEVANSGSYARVAIAFNAASGRSIAQNGLIQYTQLTGSLGTATHWCIIDSGTYGAGNALAYGAFDTGKALVSGNRPYINDGEVYVDLNNEISVYLSHKLLDLMFRNQAYSTPSTYVGLATATLDENDDGDSVSEPGGTYARLQVNENGGSTPTWNTAASGLADNADDIEVDFGAAVTAVATFVADAATSGNVLQWDNGMTDQAGGADDTMLFEAGDYNLEFL